MTNVFYFLDIFLPKNVWVSSRTRRTLDYWDHFNANTTFNNGEVFDNCDIVFLAVKPQFLEEAMNITVTKPFFGIVISVIVGVTIESLEKVS